MSDDDLIMWVIYDKPKDYPDGFVARPWAIRRGVPAPAPLDHTITAPTLGLIRRRFPPGLYRMPSAPVDDPVIVETWF
jgi:hypothetical protein